MLRKRNGLPGNGAKPVSESSSLFLLGSVFMILTVSIGFFVEREMLSGVMYYIQNKQVPSFEKFYPYQLLLTMLFAFGLPLGLVLLFVYVQRRTERSIRKRRRLILSALLIFSIVIITPAFFGRQPSTIFFGIGGFAIIAAIILSFWYVSRIRSTIKIRERAAFDYKLLGYLCFGIVTWHICGFANAPGFALFPDKMIELDVQPFAIGQLKAVMAYFVAGWIFTAVGFYKSATGHEKDRETA